MTGTIKITVIATGFDRPDMAQRGTSTHTPVDLGQYQHATWRDPAAADSGVHARLVLNRRSVVEMPSASLPAFSLGEHQATGTDDHSALDVPAFLRRSHE